MINDETIQALKCAISQEPHFVRKPLGLSCGHSICQSCVPLTERQQLRCKLCGLINRINLDELDESKAIKQLIKVHFDQLFGIIHNQYETTLKQLKDTVNEINGKLDKQLDLVKADIDDRVKTIKQDLDVLSQAFKDQLDKSKLELQKAADIDKIDMKNYEKSFYELKTDISRQQTKNETNFYQYQEKLEEMNEIVKELNNFNNEVIFRVSDLSIDKSFIGKIFFNYRSLGNVKDLSIINRLKSGIYRQTGVKVRPSDVCTLSNGSILAANCKDANLTVYDTNIKAIKTIDKISYQAFKPISIATKGEKIFICDIANHRIIRTDLEFRRCGLFGSQGFGQQQLNHPHGICYSKQHLYVCDSFNNRIVKLSSRLFFEQSYTLDYEPWQIKIANNLACVRGLNVTSIFFYDISNDMSLKYEFSGHNGIIGEIGSCFYEYYAVNRKLYFYDEKGELYEEIDTDGFNNNKIDLFGGITSIMGKLLISFEDSKKLVFI